jgi:hypothetical protein
MLRTITWPRWRKRAISAKRAGGVRRRHLGQALLDVVVRRRLSAFESANRCARRRPAPHQLWILSQSSKKKKKKKKKNILLRAPYEFPSELERDQYRSVQN